jgi:hypothetical protein
MRPLSDLPLFRPRGDSVTSPTRRPLRTVIQSAGAVVVYRKHNKPALDPLGDSLDDMGPMS